MKMWKKTEMGSFWLTLCVIAASVIIAACAETPKVSSPAKKTSTPNEYSIQPGDRLFISVWRDETLQRPVVVGPDGSISFPLAGVIQAGGMSLGQLEKELQQRLVKYIPEVAVSVSLLESLGDKVYVTGKVVRPGEYVMNRPINVIQAIALAGGITPFADKSAIKVLRTTHGEDEVFWFNYKQVAAGQDLNQNILLLPGDTVVVP